MDGLHIKTHHRRNSRGKPPPKGLTKSFLCVMKVAITYPRTPQAIRMHVAHVYSTWVGRWSEVLISYKNGEMNFLFSSEKGPTNQTSCGM